MTFFIRSTSRIWCGDLRWREYERKPSTLSLRKEALSLGANYTVSSRAMPGYFGFLTAEKLDPREQFHSLMAAVAAKFGPLYYGEYEVGIDQIWVIATDEQGKALPGSDGIYSEEAIEPLRSGFSGYGFERRDDLSRAEFEALLGELQDAPLIVRTISLRNYYLAGAVVAVGLLIAAEGIHLYRDHQHEIARERAIAAMARARKLIASKEIRHEIPPAEWVDACIAAVPASAFVHGWEVSRLDCKDNTLTVVWVRHGGTLSDAPPGDILRNGDTVNTTIDLKVQVGRKENADPAMNERALLGDLQTAGVGSQVIRSKINLAVGNHKVPTETTGAAFTWPGSPDDFHWDRYEGLRIIDMSRAVLDDHSGPSSNTSWQFKIAFSHTLLPTQKQELHK